MKKLDGAIFASDLNCLHREFPRSVYGYIYAGKQTAY